MHTRNGSLHPGADSSPSQVCCSHPNQRQGQGSTKPCSLQVCALLLAIAALTLAGSNSRAVGARVGVQCKPGGTLGWSWQASQSTMKISICCLHPGTVSKSVCKLLKSRVSIYYSTQVSPTGFLTQTGSSSSCWTTGMECLMCGLNAPLPKEDPEHVIFSPL